MSHLLSLPPQDLLLAGVEAGTECDRSDPACSYDPTGPGAGKLTCADSPCPAGQDCCGYRGGYTCCETSQTCRAGTCV